MSDVRALVVDWGGVLTGGVRDSFEAWAGTESVDPQHLAAAMRAWLGSQQDAVDNPVHRLERGEIAVPEFERELAQALRDNGSPVAEAGLLGRMMAGLEHLDPRMIGLVRAVKDAGLRTALLSNSWGNDYPREGWDTLFDAVVISGEVGMRKPEHRIYRHTLDLLGVEPAAAVFVDDLRPNVTAAVEVGMIGVLHESYEQTRMELEAVLDLDLG